MAPLHFGVYVTAVVIFLVLLLNLDIHLDVFDVWRGCLPQWLSDDTYQPLGGASADTYLLGVGKADITGPVAEINFMGYANGSQLGSGLRQRLYSRAFIVGSTTDPKDRFVYMVLDTQSGDTAVRRGILQGLQVLGPDYSMYTASNVAVTGTHSHSGPGAWLNYLLPQFTSRGFNSQSYSAIVDGAVRSIRRAHESLSPGQLSFGSTELQDANVNRSPYAYLANPVEERAKYNTDVDKEMTMLHFERADDGKSMGVLTWFPVHGTSMLGNNTLVTGDNKGVAAYLLEKSMVEAGQPDFVAGFSQSNVGDTSPNILGAYCEDGSGEMCNFQDSTCNGKNEPCHGRGPFYGLDDAGTKSCFEIGRRQFAAAKSLLQSLQTGSSETMISGHVRSLHTFKDFSNYTFKLVNGTQVNTCPGALGYSFAAGTSDGPGAFDFRQNNSGDPNASPLWTAVRDALHTPDKTQKRCQAPKPILLDSGETHSPYDWSPNIVDIQLFRVGQLIIIVSPGEATTMSGRRWKEAIRQKASEMELLESTALAPLVVLGGPANSYTHYIATQEEYGVQRYEGASTLFGQHTLNAYIDATTSLLPYLSSKDLPSRPLDPGPEPQINTNRSLTFITPVLYDRPGFFKSFGDVIADVALQYRPGDTAYATFIGASPRNNLRLEETFAEVRAVDEDGTLGAVNANDRDWELVYTWKRTNTVTATSEVTIAWEIPANAPPGLYRLVYYGDSKAFGSGTITSFMATSRSFTVGP